jgi:ElaB/YqjD/DUF883 family membrane-anchored ribosome-binding protein
MSSTQIHGSRTEVDEISPTSEQMIPSNLSTTALEHKLQKLRDQAAQHSQILTQKLASSQSGQNLLHMGTSLTTLPPDLHNLLTQLHPVLAAAEQTEEEQRQALQRLVQVATQIRQQERRVQQAAACAVAYADLLAAEGAVQRDLDARRNSSSSSATTKMVNSEPNDPAEHEALDNSTPGKPDVQLESATILPLTSLHF